MAYLFCKDGIDGTQRFELVEDTFEIGRQAECQLKIIDDVISRKHIRFVRRGSQWFVLDPGSRNGTTLDGVPINEQDKEGRPICGREHPLREGSRIRAVKFEFVFHETDAKESTSLPSESGIKTAEVKPVSPSSPPIHLDEESGSSSSTILSQVDITSSAGGVRLTSTLEARLKALIEITRSLGNTLALDQVLPKVLDSLFKVFTQADRGFIVLETEQKELIPRWFKTRPGKNEDMRLSRTIVRKVMDSKTAILSRDANTDFGQVGSVADLRIRSMMCAPLLNAEGRAFGALQIDTWSLPKAFAENDLDVLASVAVQAGIAISSAQMHEQALKQKEIDQDLVLAAEVQKAFLPSGSPGIDGYDFFAYYQAANHVGGDYYDYILLPDGRVAIVVADVTGHGIAAAMMMAKLSAEAKYCLASESDPAVAINKLNDRLSAIQVERFVTFILAMVDPHKHQVTLVNAGHMAPVWRRIDGTLAEPSHDISGLVLGIIDGQDYQAVTVDLQPGEVMAMYTDGINEAENRAGKPYGIDRIRDHVRLCNGDVEAVGRAIVADVRSFITGTTQFDDMCLVCFGRKPIAPADVSELDLGAEEDDPREASTLPLGRMATQ
jgi:sigma-B regulation protein RsbU (phosphoserine phosphatase)